LRIKPAIPDLVCHAAVEKVAASVTFSRAEQLRRLVRWLGNRSLGSSLPGPSEKEIAAEVLGRQDFDPQTDSLVRKEMSRLRDKLARYYDFEGAADEVRIAAGSGYLFSFEPSENRAGGSGKPCCLVLPFRCEPGSEETGNQLLEDLIYGLSEQGRYELVARTTAMAYRGRSGDVRQFAAECGADFVVEGSLRSPGNGIEATTWLVDGRAGLVLLSKKIRGNTASQVATIAAAWLGEQNADSEQ
jgi:TolB-like protein